MTYTIRARALRRGKLTVAVLIAVVAAMAATTTRAVAAPELPQRAATQAAASSEGLPAYADWMADVTAVTDVAQRYLDTRLRTSAKAAIVLDIDNTAPETTYSPRSVVPATDPVLRLAHLAHARGTAVFFVSDRCEAIREPTEKTDARAAIEALGYTIVANVGNRETDLVGGQAERTFKLPDYDGMLM